MQTWKIQEGKMSDREMKEIIEAMLFVWGDALSINDISSILEIKKSEAEILLDELEKEMAHERRGLTIRKYNDSYQLTTKKEHSHYLSKLFKTIKPNRLSNSAMETLALISYKQPITRLEIDQIRGVSSTSPIDTLVKRGLIEEAGRLDQIGRPILYKTTLKFLQDFDMTSLADLPELENIGQEIESQLDMGEESEN